LQGQQGIPYLIDILERLNIDAPRDSLQITTVLEREVDGCPGSAALRLVVSILLS
jgi:hypothetical protein